MKRMKTSKQTRSNFLPLFIDFIMICFIFICIHSGVLSCKSGFIAFCQCGCTVGGTSLTPPKLKLYTEKCMNEDSIEAFEDERNSVSHLYCTVFIINFACSENLYFLMNSCFPDQSYIYAHGEGGLGEEGKMPGPKIIVLSDIENFKMMQ